jgi:flagellar biosynthesis protein FlhG
MLVDQAQTLRKLMMSDHSHRARIIAVTSGKGGVGKTNIAVNLAIRLSEMGRKIILIDGDLGTANADVLCNLAPGGNLAHVVAGRKTLAQAMVPAPGGFSLIPGASGLAQMASLGEYERQNLVEQIQHLEAQSDLIILDTGAGVNPGVLSFALGADQILVVTTPEPTSVTDAYATIKTVRRKREDVDIRLLVNMVQNEEEGRQVFARIDAVCRRFLDMSIQYAGHVESDPRVGLAVRRRRPFVLESPGCPASVCIGMLAHRMDRLASEPCNTGLLRRMAVWWAS